MGIQLAEIIMAVEREFEIEVPDAEIASLRRVGDLHAFISATLVERGSGLSSEGVWLKLRDVVAEYLGLPSESISPDTDFIRDLKADG